VLDAGRDEPSGRLWLAMELLEGETLADALVATGVPRVALLRWARALLPGLAAAHRAGIVHRDLKPENVFVARTVEGEERVKILDFGIARPIGGPSATQTGVAVGTPAYMSPEQAFKPSTVGAPADCWSFGVMLYELAVGRLPFDGESAHAIVTTAAFEPHVPADEAAPGVPPRLARLIDRCLAKAPEARPDAESIGNELDAILAEPARLAALEAPAYAPRAPRGSGVASRPQGALTRTESGSAVLELRPSAEPSAPAAPAPAEPSPASRRRRALSLVLALVAVALAGVAVLALRSAGEGSDPTVSAAPPPLAPSPAPPVPSTGAPADPVRPEAELVEVDPTPRSEEAAPRPGASEPPARPLRVRPRPTGGAASQGAAEPVATAPPSPPPAEPTPAVAPSPRPVVASTPVASSPTSSLPSSPSPAPSARPAGSGSPRPAPAPAEPPPFTF
jgi:serine/threonine-protein kinase